MAAQRSVNPSALCGLFGVESGCAARLCDLAKRAERSGRLTFSAFLSPAEAQAAQAAANGSGIQCHFFGGVEGTERTIACFHEEDEDISPEEYGISTLEITWPHQPAGNAPGHRDLLGAALGIGITRDTLGDILVGEDRALIFAQSRVAPHLADSLTSAGRAKLQVALVDGSTPVVPPPGRMVHCTVASPRLDAVIAAVCHLSREDARQAVSRGEVKLRFVPTLHPDAQVKEGDTISLRGTGRFVLRALGEENRKGRIPMDVECFGF